ncbi:hypothetical protein Tco_0405082 [Tanacetum coccineum]
MRFALRSLGIRYGNTKEKKYILSLHKIHTKRFPEVDLEEKINRWVRKEFKTFNKDAWLSIQHWKDSWHKRVYKQNQRRVRNNPEDYFSNHKITEVVRITIDQPHGLDFMEQIIVMRENDKPNSFSEADFKYLNTNDIEDLYYLCRNKKLGIESYQIKVNLTVPTLIFLGIEAHEPYSIVDKPSTGLIYLNIKDEKQVMYLTEIVKFCDATLEKVLNEMSKRLLDMCNSKYLMPLNDASYNEHCMTRLGYLYAMADASSVLIYNQFEPLPVVYRPQTKQIALIALPDTSRCLCFLNGAESGRKAECVSVVVLLVLYWPGSSDLFLLSCMVDVMNVIAYKQR